MFSFISFVQYLDAFICLLVTFEEYNDERDMVTENYASVNALKMVYVMYISFTLKYYKMKRKIKVCPIDHKLWFTDWPPAIFFFPLFLFFCSEHFRVQRFFFVIILLLFVDKDNRIAFLSVYNFNNLFSSNEFFW